MVHRISHCYIDILNAIRNWIVGNNSCSSDSTTAVFIDTESI